MKKTLMSISGLEQVKGHHGLTAKQLASRIISEDHIPAELRDASRAYYSRMQKVRAMEQERSPLDPNVDNLLTFMQT